jgi:hypothetical protein
MNLSLLQTRLLRGANTASFRNGRKRRGGWFRRKMVIPGGIQSKNISPIIARIYAAG